MGSGGQKQAMKEIPATKAAAQQAAFDALIERIEVSGGAIEKDEEVPLFTDVGNEEIEVGIQRIVEFMLNGNEFQLIRKTETSVLQGGGMKKHVEPLEIPRTRDTLKKRDLSTGQWQVIDLEDML